MEVLKIGSLNVYVPLLKVWRSWKCKKKETSVQVASFQVVTAMTVFYSQARSSLSSFPTVLQLYFSGGE